MQGSKLAILTAVLLLVAGLSVSAAKPAVSAHGELRITWPRPALGTVWSIQLAFNVQSRGALGSHGTISMRVFDQPSGKLVGVALSTCVYGLEVVSPGKVVFLAEFTAAGGGPMPGPPVWEFWATDGGSTGPDEFLVLPLVGMTMDCGKVFVRE